MATKASGVEYVNQESEVLGNIGEYFNNHTFSDVTLTVGEQVFVAHRFVLAAQSKVFHSMLLGENWKESVEQNVTLEELPHSEEAFSDFLKFFYTGKLTLTSENVCSIHTLADKYGLLSLKENCFGFMKDVLTGNHGDALESAFEWIQYIEVYVQDLVAACYSAIRANFIGINRERAQELKGKLTDNQLENILTIGDVMDDIVVEKEVTLFGRIKLLCSATNSCNSLLPLIRFYNMDADDLQKYEAYNQGVVKSYCSHAYKVQAEREKVASKACDDWVSDGGELRCPCSEGNPCPHINPRFYLARPFGKYSKMGRPLSVEPMDLSDLERYSQKVMSPGDRDVSKEWKVSLQGDYSDDTICERYTLKPSVCHVGRRFTLAIVCVDTEPEIQLHNYTIKHTDVVTMGEGNQSDTDPLVLSSPLRFKGSWEIGNHHFYGISILLHKVM